MAVYYPCSIISAFVHTKQMYTVCLAFSKLKQPQLIFCLQSLEEDHNYSKYSKHFEAS